MTTRLHPLTIRSIAIALTLSCGMHASSARAQLAVRGRVVHTMAGPAITDGIVIMRDGKIAAVGPASQISIPDEIPVMEAAVVVPGLIDAHSTVGLSGIYNTPHDQDQLERSSPIQPELRAIDAYNSREKLVDWVRGFGVTTLHTGHAPGELISGQTAVVKTFGDTVEDAVIVPTETIAATLSPAALKQERGKSPGTRGKAMAMLRAELIKTQEYVRKLDIAEPDKKPDRDLRLETLARVLRREIPLMITAQRAQDIASALRLATEFSIRIWIDGAAEAYLVIDEIKAAGVPVILHPPMARAFGEMENSSFETAARLRAAGIPVAMQSGYEDYVPKSRVVLFEAAITAAHGLSFEQALALITIDAARILGVESRIGSIEVGKDADLALFDGDPFEYTTHCVATIINGQVASRGPR